MLLNANVNLCSFRRSSLTQWCSFVGNMPYGLPAWQAECQKAKFITKPFKT